MKVKQSLFQKKQKLRGIHYQHNHAGTNTKETNGGRKNEMPHGQRELQEGMKNRKDKYTDKPKYTFTMKQ